MTWAEAWRQPKSWLGQMLRVGVVASGFHLVYSAAERDVARALYPYGPVPGMLVLFAVAVALGYAAERFSSRLTKRRHVVAMTVVIAAILYVPLRYFIFDLRTDVLAHPQISFGEVLVAIAMSLVAGMVFGIGMWRRLQS